MIVLDTHVLVHDALDPKRLSKRARSAIAEGEEAGSLACCDISLWEIAMLLARGRIEVHIDAREFVESIVDARALRVLPITPAIAVLAQSDDLSHGDPADRLIAATTMAHRARLVTSDSRLRRIPQLSVVW